LYIDAGAIHTNGSPFACAGDRRRDGGAARRAGKLYIEPGMRERAVLLRGEDRHRIVGGRGRES
jgi:hypothetical protein